MHLVVPFRDNSGRPFAAEKYAEVRQILTERFGGLTAFLARPPRAPRQAEARRCTTRLSCSNHDGNAGRGVVEELPNSVGACRQDEVIVRA